MKQKAWLLLLLIAGLAACLIGCQQTEFTGSRAAAPDSYHLEIERMTGTDTHSLTLDAGDTLQIQFETEAGSIYLEIKAPDGTMLYGGNGTNATSFTVQIPESGVYPIVVEARHAKGSIHIQRHFR